ncbi:MAG TPA: cytochrome c oxidase subunit II [Allosphingosinicella sp.]|jgi:cytochrome c oxidase subunit 2|nr:cytochrome c oxidase subunit II [Allosphingosinicella sp.]
MKIIFKLAAVAAAFGLAPAAGLAAMPGAPPGTTDTPTLAPAPAPGVAPAPAEATANAATPAAAPAVAPPRTAPTAGIGQPDGRLGLQEQVSPIGQEAAWFHNVILMPLITVISAFVLLLLGWVMFRYRRSRNPVPSRNTHNTTLEVVWTLVPVLILVVIAVPSIRLLAHQYDFPRSEVTIKAIGNQWFWEYEYPDHGIHVTSRIVTDAQAAARGEPRQLAVDDRMVVPVGTNVRMIVTSNDVIHAWGVPAFWTKIDAVPGRLNETWFRADRTGVFYGVCYELCGAQHGYMPIAVEVVTQEQFRAWVAAQPGGHMPGAQPAAAAPAAAPAGGNIVAGAETPATTNQSATR